MNGWMDAREMQLQVMGALSDMAVQISKGYIRMELDEESTLRVFQEKTTVQVTVVVRDSKMHGMLQEYLKLVAEDRWDTPVALQMRRELDDWAHEHAPALVAADMDIRRRPYRREKKAKGEG